ncbi:clustered mitochondria protein-like isoform X2 [Aristolochia californica]|uniref:clustered mitochondria protein-like isoform X2 n=1 Tax=Aristolochia californica TaxID=171875 RepID=UPI0035DA6706
MAGKSNKSKNKGKASSATNSSVSLSVANSTDSAVFPTDKKIDVEASSIKENGVQSCDSVDKSVALDDFTNATAKTEGTDAASMSATNQSKQADGDLHLYTVSVKAQSVEKLELHLNPGDSVMDLRQFLLDAPETCFFTCYDLLLHTKDGSVHRLEDYNELSEVGDITTGGCSLEMVPALYDDRSIRSHLRRVRDLLSLSTIHSSLSTSLALQLETSQIKTTGSTKTEFPELDGLGFMEDVTGSLGSLLASSSKEIRCLESMVFSSFNPPPSYRRLVGDLIYLDIATFEGNKYCVTGSTRTFFVNMSVGNVLDPRPAKPASEATTLIGLLQKISPKFKKGFREILERRASTHPFENVQSLLPANSWVGVFPIPDHKRDAARAEDALTLSYGSDLIGMQRDWNDELQSCRELPHKTLQERIVRDRALYKVTCDFVDAAVNGAVGVINRCIPPINPTDPECFHMYVHNNIFFSFAVDADLGKSSSTVATLTIHPNREVCESSRFLAETPVTLSGNESVAETSVTLSGNKSFVGLNSLPRGASSVQDLNGVADVAEDASPEGQLVDSEQATYVSANNDLKGTKAYQEADIPGLYNLAMAIIDYRGHRVVAQSIIPGILHGDKSESLLYGSVDNGKKICWNEAFHLKVLEAAKRLHLKEHTVVDGSGNTIKLAAPVECKGIVGSDDRHYLLDLMRVTPRDANFSGPGSRFCVLRPELISAFCQADASGELKSKTDEEVSADLNPKNATSIDAEVASEVSTSVSNFKDGKGSVNAAQESAVCKEILLNPNVFTDFKLGDGPEEIAADEEGVRKASNYLVDVVLPKFVQDLFSLEVSPMDGQTLTEAFHAHGINVRYIGKVADLTCELPHIWDLCVIEIAIRSAKHVIKDVLRESQDHELGPAVSHFFNCFFGNVVNLAHVKNPKKDQSSGKPVKKQTKSNLGAFVRKNQSAAHTHISSDSLWSDVQEFAKSKYRFELPEDVRLRVKKISAIRNLCQKAGIVITARKYNLEAASPFETSDVLNLQPVVKHSVPVCSEARDLVETGKVKLADGMLNEAYALFVEAFSIFQQVTGPMHREVANCCRYLAMVLYHSGDMAGAIMQQHKELIINERCLGLDHPDTVHSYGNMALFYHGLNQTELALRHMSRTLLLLSLSCGSDHPDVAATFINVAMMYQDIGRMNIALRYLQEALKKTERLLGPDHIQTAHCYHALAIAFNCIGAYKLSLQHEKKTYDILVKQLGKEDSRTLESQNWIEAFKVRDNQVNAQKQKGQAMNILKAAAAGSNKSISAALVGENLPRGRGVDERAARAAAEVRKKAAARGLHVRTHGAQVQTLPPLAQLLNMINSGATSNVQADAQANELKTESSSNGAGNVKEKGSLKSQEEPAPVGLGTSLASLDSRKQKSKPNNTS